MKLNPLHPEDWLPSLVPGWFGTREIAEYLGCKRQQVAFVASREGWQRNGQFHSSFYPADQVRVYAVLRLRTELASQLGRLNVRGLLRELREGEADTRCPECRAYAFSYNRGALCVNGHHFRLEE